MDPKVLVIVGSKSDEEAMQGCLDNLRKFDIPYEFHVSSAHRAPERGFRNRSTILARPAARGYNSGSAGCRPATGPPRTV